jgi:translation initiation factor IF-2
MPNDNRTHFAIKALTLADTFNVMLKEERVRGPITYRVELSAPDGPSTAGGKQATQHVKLVPEGGGATVVAGSANQAESWAELRTFEHLQILHAQRFHGAEVPVNRVQYNELLGKLQAFFNERGLHVRRARMPSGGVAMSRSRGTSGMLIIGLILVAALASAAGISWYLIHR